VSALTPLKNACEIANTLAHVGLPLVVLALLQKRWNLRGREGFFCEKVERGLGSSLPPVELARWDSALLRK
jgi:hypothetical protein